MPRQKMRNRQKQIQIRKRKIWAIKSGLLLLCILIVYGVIQLSLWGYVKKNTTNAIPQGIAIGEIDASGMSKTEAAKALDQLTTSYQDAKIVVQLDKNRTLTTTAKALGVGIKDEKKLIDQAYNYNREGSFFHRWKKIRARKKSKQTIAIPYVVDDDMVKKLLKKKCTSLLTAPVNAKLSVVEKKTVLTPGKAGEVMDLDTTIKGLNRFLNKKWKGDDGTVTLAVKDEQPKINEEDLKDIQDLLGSYTTFYSADGTAHAHNVELGAENVGDRILAPGEKLSVDKALKSRTKENGYEKAGSYESGTVVQTYGGGICQVSTTLYNAVLYAELEVLERSPHSMKVAYVDPSRDAAIAEGTTDFVFQNNLKNPVYIESELNDGNITFYIFGKETRAKGRTVEFESEILKTENLDGTKFVTVDQPIGYFTQIAPYEGMDAQLWKIVKQDGEQVSKDVINTSHYQATVTTYSVGITSDNTQASSVVANAVGTQNEATIRAAIDTALSYGASESAQ